MTHLTLYLHHCYLELVYRRSERCHDIVQVGEIWENAFVWKGHGREEIVDGDSIISIGTHVLHILYTVRPGAMSMLFVLFGDWTMMIDLYGKIVWRIQIWHSYARQPIPLWLKMAISMVTVHFLSVLQKSNKPCVEWKLMVQNDQIKAYIGARALLSHPHEWNVQIC